MRKLFFWIAMLALIATLLAAPTTDVARTRIADGFDFPVGKPDADGYYTSRGFMSYHPGEDWNGLGGGNSDLGAPVYGIGSGLVVFARNARMGWGNVVIVRHIYFDGGMQIIDSMYAHLDRINVRQGQQIVRGQQVGTIGTNRGMYVAHLHFEVRKNIYIGLNRSLFRKDLSNYFVPSKFIVPRRQINGGGRTGLVAINTFQQRSSSKVSSSRLDSRRAGSGLDRSEGKASPSPQKSGWRVDRFGEAGSF